MAVANARTAIARFLKDEVSGAEGRVFRPELPRSEQEFMPRKCIVVYSGGGGGMMGASELEAIDSIIDLDIYGSNRLEGEELADEAVYALRTKLKRQTVEGVLIHWARIAGGLRAAVDNKTEWPYSIVTIQVLHSFP